MGVTIQRFGSLQISLVLSGLLSILFYLTNCGDIESSINLSPIQEKMCITYPDAYPSIYSLIVCSIFTVLSMVTHGIILNMFYKRKRYDEMSVYEKSAQVILWISIERMVWLFIVIINTTFFIVIILFMLTYDKFNILSWYYFFIILCFLRVILIPTSISVIHWIFIIAASRPTSFSTFLTVRMPMLLSILTKPLLFSRYIIHIIYTLGEIQTEDVEAVKATNLRTHNAIKAMTEGAKTGRLPPIHYSDYLIKYSNIPNEEEKLYQRKTQKNYVLSFKKRKALTAGANTMKTPVPHMSDFKVNYDPPEILKLESKLKDEGELNDSTNNNKVTTSEVDVLYDEIETSVSNRQPWPYYKNK